MAAVGKQGVERNINSGKLRIKRCLLRAPESTLCLGEGEGARFAANQDTRGKKISSPMESTRMLFPVGEKGC